MGGLPMAAALKDYANAITGRLDRLQQEGKA